LSQIWQGRKIADALEKARSAKAANVLTPAGGAGTPMSLLESCKLNGPSVLLDISELPASHRANGDPCSIAEQCTSGNCICKHYGGKECSSHEAWPTLSFNFQSFGSSFAVPSGVTADQLLAAVQPSGSGYCTKQLTDISKWKNSAVCGGSDNNVGYSVSWSWWQECDQQGDFRFGVDFGLGWGVLVDGQLFASYASNANYNYLAGDWSNTSGGVIQVLGRTWAKGKHTIQVIGMEGCCGDFNYVQYRAPGGDWKNVDDTFCFGPCSAAPTTENLTAAVVPTQQL